MLGCDVVPSYTNIVMSVVIPKKICLTSQPSCHAWMTMSSKEIPSMILWWKWIIYSWEFQKNKIKNTKDNKCDEYKYDNKY